MPVEADCCSDHSASASTAHRTVEKNGPRETASRTTSLLLPRRHEKYHPHVEVLQILPCRSGCVGCHCCSQPPASRRITFDVVAKDGAPHNRSLRHNSVAECTW